LKYLSSGGGFANSGILVDGGICAGDGAVAAGTRGAGVAGSAFAPGFPVLMRTGNSSLIGSK
jgi:hypothetical protein